MRVDRLVKGLDEEGKPKLSSLNDYTTTLFVGNMPFTISEEEVRAHFSPFGKILNIRLIRDSKTYLGKGIGYVQFENKLCMKKAME